MSRGTPTRTLRVPEALATEIDVTIRRRNDHTREEPFDWTAFALTAIAEKILKMARSGKRPRPLALAAFHIRTRRRAPGSNGELTVDHASGNTTT